MKSPVTYLRFVLKSPVTYLHFVMKSSTVTYLCFVMKSAVYSFSGDILLTVFSIFVYTSKWSLEPKLVSLWYSSKKSLLEYTNNAMSD